jgi:hypothetical protein
MAEEAVDRVEEAGQPPSVEARRRAPFDEAIPQRVIGLPLGRSLSLCTRPEDADIAPINKREGQATDAAEDREKSHQRRSDDACRSRC